MKVTDSGLIIIDFIQDILRNQIESINLLTEKIILYNMVEVYTIGQKGNQTYLMGGGMGFTPMHFFWSGEYDVPLSLIIEAGGIHFNKEDKELVLYNSDLVRQVLREKIWNGSENQSWWRDHVKS